MNRRLQYSIDFGYYYEWVLCPVLYVRVESVVGPTYNEDLTLAVL